MRVLVVDDQENMCWILARVLTQAGFEVVTAGSGAEALARVAAEPVDAAILDYRLPDQNGLAVLAELQRQLPGLTAVLITSYGSAELKRSALAHGFHAYFDKPFNTWELIASLRAIAGQKI